MRNTWRLNVRDLRFPKARKSQVVGLKDNQRQPDKAQMAEIEDKIWHETFFPLELIIINQRVFFLKRFFWRKLFKVSGRNKELLS